MARRSLPLGRKVGGLALGSLLLAVLLSACGGGSSTASTTTTSTASATPGASSHRVTAIESEYKIVLSTSALKPGSSTFVTVNKGTIGHALAINGPGVASKQTSTISPGASQTLTVTLSKGTYDVYCPISGHKALGMDTKVTVQ